MLWSGGWGWGSVGKGAFGRRHLRNSGRPGYGDRWVSCTGKPADIDNGGLVAVAETLLGFRAREGVCVCAHARGGFGVCVCVCVLCVEGGRGVFEEMTRVLKILLRGSQRRE